MGLKTNKMAALRQALAPKYMRLVVSFTDTNLKKRDDFYSAQQGILYESSATVSHLALKISRLITNATYTTRLKNIVDLRKQVRGGCRRNH